ncbi:ABC-type multidrug transport system, ATPase component [Synechococcus sp. PCC 7502]|uniref:ABC transporter ATP-binding protein n=1 Tax=Synechococcus sp. PCC 7502 TaxID=1173263 RepID=UPI00029FB0AB|nr:ABC transporter ATP-binding protein [Synechococcus sp. PCC 7502]AFY72460.1 ABC-type multidrug transport system, ATPase component [Synechococcus sp. PCC 7502]
MLKIQNLSKFYGDRQVLRDINLHIPAGEIYGLLGRNGAGKTTLINIICNLINADSGAIAIDNQSIGTLTKSMIGIVPQENLLYEGLTCYENLDFFATLYGLTGQLKQQRIQNCLAAVNLTDRAKSIVGNLSGGMKRRINIAIALVHAPKLVILDEPTTGLDIEARYQIWELINQLRYQGMTLLLTTHLLEEAERLCQRIGILKNGELLIEGSLSELGSVIPAAAILIMHTPVEELAIARGQSLGFSHHRYGNDLAFWLPEHRSLQEIVTLFGGIAIDSISIQPVRLENIYVELTRERLEPSIPLVSSLINT